MLLCTAASVWAQESEADRAFAGAVKLFQGGWFEQADKELGQFVAASPGSSHYAEAVLLQAQSCFQLKKFDNVISLLQPQLFQAGPLADQYRFWLAEAHSQQERYEVAANLYADLLKESPASPLRLEASYGEAWTRFKLGDTARTVELLRAPTSAFQQAAKGSTNEPILLRGAFLLAEALFAQKNFPDAAQTLTELAQRGLSPEAEWQRQYLLARIEMSSSRADAAMARITNLVAIALARTNTVLQARSLTLKGEILEDKQPEAAVQTYEDIGRIPALPADQKRQALLKLVDLAVAQNRLPNAVERLDTYLRLNPQDQALDLLRFTLGEIYLKQFYALAPPSAQGSPATNSLAATNFLQSARNEFDVVVNQLTNSPYLGKAQLNRGWSFWEEAQLAQTNTAKLLLAQKAFQAAILALPSSIDQAQARFKLADVQLALKDYPAALANYRLLLDQYSELAEVKDKLLDHALYQTVRASIESGNLAEAQTAVRRMLADFPNSPWSDDALFLYGQGLADAAEYAKAQETFGDLQKRFPQSPLLPAARLAIARLAVQQADWPAAIQLYDQWIAQFEKDPARPQAEFDRAWCYYQAGNETNAFRLMTDLVQQYPGSATAPLAQLWIGDYYLNQRDPPQYDQAEKHYQLLFSSTNSVPTGLARHAMLMAAKAAFFRQGFRDATNYLINLVNDPQLVNDTQVGPQAWFMLGDIELESRDAPNKLAKFEEAINRFARVTNLYSTSPLAPLAMGKIADCHFQLAAQNTNRYDMATNQCWQIIKSPLADVSTRSQAEFLLGKCLEKMAEFRTNRTDLLDASLTHYLNIVYSRRLQGENPDPFWLNKAALAAGSLAADQLGAVDKAERLYRDMITALPSLAPLWQKRLESLQQQRAR